MLLTVDWLHSMASSPSSFYASHSRSSTNGWIHYIQIVIIHEAFHSRRDWGFSHRLAANKKEEGKSTDWELETIVPKSRQIFAAVIWKSNHPLTDNNPLSISSNGMSFGSISGVRFYFSPPRQGLRLKRQIKLVARKNNNSLIR